MNKNNYAIIMAGGIGSRFWPMSRTNCPKQFLDILGTGRTLLQSTYDRFSDFIMNDNIYVITSEEYIDIVKEQLQNIPLENIIGEPERKNTAPCVAYISQKLQLLNPESNLIIAPSDHLISNQGVFRDACIQGLNFTAENNAFVTLGIEPSSPNTGYGYIKTKLETELDNIFPVEKFTEKPNLEKALVYYRDFNYFWNSGIFIWKSSDIIAAFETYMPELIQLFQVEKNRMNTSQEKEAVKSIYEKCPSISIDYAIMEHAENVYLIPAKFEWSDLGTWNSAWDNYSKDEYENASIGQNNMLIDSKGCMVHSSDKKLIVLGGMEDTIVVNTADTILICKRENEQQIKDYLAKVKDLSGNQYI